MKKKNILVSYLIILSCALPLVGISSKLLIFNELKLKNPKTSNSWDLSGSAILIDDANPDYSWSKISSENDWCTGSGTWNDPYIIEHVTIIGSSNQNCIEIRNSNVPFTIKNCILHHPGGGTGHRGIRLFETSNGLIINNRIKYCGEGISLQYSNMNNISGCSSNYNWRGLHMDESDSNIIENCAFKYNSEWGIAIPFGGNDASNNIIRRNLIQFNGEYGIRIHYDEPVNNSIYLNYFVENGIDAYDFGTNTQWDNGTIGNYWYDYSGVDGNSDGIGDTLYNFGTGFDLYPIYRERPSITITSPLFNERFKSPPYFNIEVSGSDLDKIWYSLNDDTNIYLIQESGTIDLTAWNALQIGNITIRFYINDSFGIYNYEEVVIVKDTSYDILITSIIIGLLATISISLAGIIVWKRKFSGRSLYVKSPEKIKIVKKKLLELGTQFEHLRIGEIAERCGVLERTVVSILKEMIKNKEIYAKYYKTESFVTFDQQLITEEIDQLMENYRNWERRTFGKKID